MATKYPTWTDVTVGLQAIPAHPFMILCFLGLVWWIVIDPCIRFFRMPHLKCKIRSDQQMLPLVPNKPSSARLLLEEGFLPPLGSQVFEGFAWLLGPWLVSVLLIPLTAILVYGQFEVRGQWPMCYGIFEM